MPKYVNDFAEGNPEMRDLLGASANLAEMTNLDLPVPPGDHHRGVPVLSAVRA